MGLQYYSKARFPLGDFFRAKRLFLLSCELSTGTIRFREKSRLVENGLYSLNFNVNCRSFLQLKAPVTLYRIDCVSDYFSYRIGASFTLQRSDPVGAKSLRSGGDTKSNPICAVP